MEMGNRRGCWRHRVHRYRRGGHDQIGNPGHGLSLVDDLLTLSGRGMCYRQSIRSSWCWVGWSWDEPSTLGGHEGDDGHGVIVWRPQPLWCRPIRGHRWNRMEDRTHATATGPDHTQLSGSLAPYTTALGTGGDVRREPAP